MKMELNKNEIDLLNSWCHLLETFVPMNGDYLGKADTALMKKVKHHFWKYRETHVSQLSKGLSTETVNKLKK